MTGPVEEAGKVATGFIDAMKTQPLALALCLMNILLLALFYFILSALERRQNAREETAAKEQMHIRELLARCIVPEKRTELHPFTLDAVQTAVTGKDQEP